jgi:hypothetical protein
VLAAGGWSVLAAGGSTVFAAVGSTVFVGGGSTWLPSASSLSRRPVIGWGVSSALLASGVDRP